MQSPKGRDGFVAAAVVLLLAVLTAYSNHFSNPFELDDHHTIVGNESIRDLRNIPRFFTDATTFSTLPANQAYRPGTTMLNALDTWRGGTGQPEPRAFHSSIFLSFLVLGVCLFIFLRSILAESFDRPWVRWAALAGTGLFLLHTANAETINYVIARSDSFSTLMVLAAFVVYLRWPALRRFHLYLIPFAAGALVKETALMFAPLLFAYLLLFREGLPLGGLLASSNRTAFARALRSAAPALLVAVGLFALSQAMVSSTFRLGGVERWRYLLTQPFVLFHYVCNFVVPVNLVIESDWTAFTNAFDERAIAGLGFVVLLLVAAVRASRTIVGRPIAFGILWFFIAAAPTSSIFPLSEVVNGHRPFFPYVGLTLAACGLACAVIVRHEHRLRDSVVLRAGLGAAVVLLLVAHAWGVHRRNEIWSSRERLWEEAARKGPGSGRILMNYALELMARADYAGARNYLERARAVAPDYSYIHVNLGVLTDALGNAREAEAHFSRALALDELNPETYVFYAAFLRRQAREEEALELARRGLAVSPAHTELRAFLAAPATPEGALNRSLELYHAGRFEESLAAAEQAVALRSDWDRAWNNVCAALNRLGRWEEAIAAGERAVQLNPDNELARNNLAEARRQRGLAAGAAQSAPSSN